MTREVGIHRFTESRKEVLLGSSVSLQAGKVGIYYTNNRVCISSLTVG
jgi:hypothetical protein